MAKNIKINFISEEAQPTEIEILEESVVPGQMVQSGLPFGNQAYRVKFKARLQTANQPNNNKRIYPTETLQEVYNQLKPKIDEGKLLGELDHPQVQTTDKNGQLKRSSTILLQNSCVHFLDMTYDGINIDAICQTTTNRAGLDAYSFIKDGVTIGFSLRAFGDIKQDGQYIKVTPKSLKAITYDLVSMPSHGNALILEIINESTNINELVRDLKDYKETIKKVSEDKGLTSIEESEVITESGLVCSNGICSLRPIEETIDYLIEQAIAHPTFKKIKLKLK